MKKFLSLLLILTLVLSAGIPAFGAEVDSQALEKAIAVAKNIVEVPESYSDFNYSTSQTTVNDKTYTYWNLSWNDVVNGGSLYATVDEDGNLTNYYYYKNVGVMEQGLSKITKAQGLQTASEFLAKAIPGYGSKMRQIVNPDQTVYGQEYLYNFKLYVNDVPVDFASTTVAVNRYTGEVSSYYYNGIIADLKLTAYPAVTGVIDLEKAGQAYVDEINVPLKYYGYYDYMKRSLKVFPVYEFSNYGKAIDAKTGKVIEIFADDYGYFRGADGMGSAESTNGGKGDSFTEEELAAIEKTQNLIDRGEAERIARIYGTDMGELQYANLESHYVEKNKYFWNLGFEKGYASVNATTSELASFSIYEDFKYTGGGISQEKAMTIAEDFLKKIAPEKFEQSRYTENQYLIYDTESAYYYMNFVRQVNGIDFTNNNLNVTVNKVTGKVISYYSEWYDAANFPSIEKAISEKAAFDKGADIVKYGLMYKKTSATEVALVYDFMDGNGMMLNALTGERINWDGTTFVTGNAYTDIKGNWAESMILELQENGYNIPRQESNRFNPKNTTTQIEFLRYLYSPVQSQYTEDDAFYNMLITNGVIKKEEINASQNITRQEVAKYVTRFFGFEKLAQKTDIFRNFFKDVPPAGYQGYASICYAFDIIKGDAKGNFSGSKTITHAEVAKVIYKTLQAK